MIHNKIISALIGLVGACNNNLKTENTDSLVIKTLAFPLVRSEADDEVLQALIEEIYAEKYAIAPGCATCQTPCGNTSDYDMNRIYDAEADLLLRMEVPCCGGLEMAAQKALQDSGKSIPMQVVTLSIDGRKI